MDADDFQERCHETAIHGLGVGNQAGINYAIIGLLGEAGEIANKWKKILRGDPDEVSLSDAIAAELGDTLWYCAELAQQLGYTLTEIMEIELEKIMARQKAGTLRGSGDSR